MAMMERSRQPQPLMPSWLFFFLVFLRGRGGVSEDCPPCWLVDTALSGVGVDDFMRRVVDGEGDGLRAGFEPELLPDLGNGWRA